jgi:propionate CoA-transferase
LTEVAPGIDLESQVLAQMDFRPEIAPNLRDMDGRIFREAAMGLAKGE